MKKVSKLFGRFKDAVRSGDRSNQDPGRSGFGSEEAEFMTHEQVVKALPTARERGQLADLYKKVKRVFGVLDSEKDAGAKSSKWHVNVDSDQENPAYEIVDTAKSQVNTAQGQVESLIESDRGGKFAALRGQDPTFAKNMDAIIAEYRALSKANKSRLSTIKVDPDHDWKVDWSGRSAAKSPVAKSKPVYYELEPGSGSSGFEAAAKSPAARSKSAYYELESGSGSSGSGSPGSGVYSHLSPPSGNLEPAVNEVIGRMKAVGGFSVALRELAGKSTKAKIAILTARNKEGQFSALDESVRDKIDDLAIAGGQRRFGYPSRSPSESGSSEVSWDTSWEEGSLSRATSEISLPEPFDPMGAPVVRTTGVLPLGGGEL